jgi:hypothetical protein
MRGCIQNKSGGVAQNTALSKRVEETINDVG